MQFKVTLAHKVSERLDLSQGVYIQPKLDGVRCYSQIVDGELKMFSRNHKEFKNCAHLQSILKDYADQHNCIFDGELYNHVFKDNFNKIISLVRKQKPTEADREESSLKLQYHIYDVFFIDEPNLSYSERKARLDAMIRDMKDDSVREVETNYIEEEPLMFAWHNINKENGYEGSMLRADVAYEQRRTHNLAKVKDWHDTEFTITGWVPGKGKFAGGLGKFLGVDDEGREVEVPWQSITMEFRREIAENINDWIGKYCTFEYFERTPAGAYRFPRFKAVRNYE